MIKKTLISNCDTITDWNITSGTVTIDTTIKDKESGKGSIKCVTSATAYQTAGAEITGDWNLWETSPLFSIWFDVTSPPDRFVVEVYSGSSKYSRRIFSRDRMVPGMFWDVAFNKSDAKFFNGFTDDDYNNITKIRAYFTTTSAVSKTGYINSFKMMDLKNEPTIIFRNDDGLLTDYTVIMPKLEEYGFKFNSFVITNILDGVTNPDYMTKAQIKEVYDAGNDVGSHTNSHVYLSHLDEHGQVQEIAESNKKLLNEGFTRSYKLFVAPYFDSNISALKKIKDYFLMTGIGMGWCGDNTLGITGGIQSYPMPPQDFKHISDATGLANVSNINLWKSALDRVYHYGELLVIGSHEVDNIDLFNQIVDYIAEKGFNVITFSQLYNQNFKQSGKIRIDQMIP